MPRIWCQVTFSFLTQKLQLRHPPPQPARPRLQRPSTPPLPPSVNHPRVRRHQVARVYQLVPRLELRSAPPPVVLLSLALLCFLHGTDRKRTRSSNKQLQSAAVASSSQRRIHLRYPRALKCTTSLTAYSRGPHLVPCRTLMRQVPSETPISGRSIESQPSCDYIRDMDNT